MPPKFSSSTMNQRPKSDAEKYIERITSLDTSLNMRGLNKEDIRMIPPDIKIAWGRAEEMLKQRVQPNSFQNVQSLKSKISETERYTKEREKGVRLDREKMYAIVLEAILFDEIQKKHWFGQEARAFLTSDYDDYKNGADLAVEMQGENQSLEPHPILFAIDATYSETISRIQSKIQKAFDKIKQGHMGQILFYESKNKRFRGQVDYVPVLTVGVSKPVIQEMSKLWIDKNTRGELEKHPAQLLVRAQSYAQLQAFNTYLERHSETPNRDTLIPIIQAEISMANQIPQNISIPERYKNDPVHVAIMRETNIFAQS